MTDRAVLWSAVHVVSVFVGWRPCFFWHITLWTTVCLPLQPLCVFDRPSWAVRRRLVWNWLCYFWSRVMGDHRTIIHSLMSRWWRRSQRGTCCLKYHSRWRRRTDGAQSTGTVLNLYFDITEGISLKVYQNWQALILLLYKLNTVFYDYTRFELTSKIYL